MTVTWACWVGYRVFPQRRFPALLNRGKKSFNESQPFWETYEKSCILNQNGGSLLIVEIIYGAKFEYFPQ